MRHLAILLLALTCAGCAWTTESIDVPYQSAGGLTSIAHADSVTIAVHGSDAREDHRDRVSSKKNGYGMEAAPITAANDIADTVRRGVETELSQRGFAIGPNGVMIDVALRRFYNDFKTGFFSGQSVADFEAVVTVRGKDGASRFSQVYFAQGTEPDIQMMNGTNARLALMKAMAEGVRKISSDPALIEAIFHAQAGERPTS